MYWIDCLIFSQICLLLPFLVFSFYFRKRPTLSNLWMTPSFGARVKFETSFTIRMLIALQALGAYFWRPLMIVHPSCRFRIRPWLVTLTHLLFFIWKLAFLLTWTFFCFPTFFRPSNILCFASSLLPPSQFFLRHLNSSVWLSPGSKILSNTTTKGFSKFWKAGALKNIFSISSRL